MGGNQPSSRRKKSHLIFKKTNLRVFFLNSNVRSWTVKGSYLYILIFSGGLERALFPPELWNVYERDMKTRYLSRCVMCLFYVSRPSSRKVNSNRYFPTSTSEGTFQHLVILFYFMSTLIWFFHFFSMHFCTLHDCTYTIQNICQMLFP
jgi:hypothetical protein